MEKPISRRTGRWHLLALVSAIGLVGVALWSLNISSQGQAQTDRANSTGHSTFRAVPPEAAVNNRGVAYARKGKYDQAIGYFQLALYFDKSSLAAHKNLLAAYVETKQWPEALNAGEEAEALYPLSSELHKDALPEDAKKVKQLHEDRGFIANLGRAYLETGDLSKAENRYMLFVRLAPNELEGYNGLGETVFRQGDYGKALQLFAQSLRLYGEQPEIEARIAEIAKKSADLAGKAQWLLSNYVQGGRGASGGMPPAMPGAPVPGPQPPLTGPQLPQAPAPGIVQPMPQAPVPQPQAPAVPQ
jgi:tetratricopeptide (TPR) repeat protein